jgi:hypothetical protein
MNSIVPVGFLTVAMSAVVVGAVVVISTTWTILHFLRRKATKKSTQRV